MCIRDRTQILRKQSNTPLQVEVELLQTASHDSKNTAAEHLETFYTTFDAVRDKHFDGLIITGAPVERLEFEEVDYWPELCEIMEWSVSYTHLASPSRTASIMPIFRPWKLRISIAARGALSP